MVEHPQCEYCKDRFKSDTDLQSHKERVHKCPACNLFYHPVLVHLKQHSYCELCKKWFLDEKTYHEHLAEHPCCEYCKNRFSTQVDLTNHIDRDHKCYICHEYFSNIYSHMEKEHPYCQKCRKHFLNKGNYNEKHLKCQYCDERFETNQLLEQHVRLFHYCLLCKKYFNSLDTHTRSPIPNWRVGMTNLIKNGDYNKSELSYSAPHRSTAE